MFNSTRRKMPNPKPKSMTCRCGKDAKDGYTVYVPPKYHYQKDIPMRVCCECYEQEVRSLNYRKNVSSSVTRGYYV